MERDTRAPCGRGLSNRSWAMHTHRLLDTNRRAALLMSRPAILLVALLVSAACGGRPELRGGPAPWVAPGSRVTVYFRRGSDPGLGRFEWRDTVRHRKYNPYRLADQVEQFMVARAMFDHWLPTGLVDLSEGEPIREVIAPFRFTLVSVDPMVVLMTPHAFPPNVSTFDMPGRNNVSFPGIRHMRNNIELGTTAPFADGMQFFLPEQKVGPAPLQWSNDEASIPLGSGERLLLTRSDTLVEVQRLR